MSIRQVDDAIRTIDAVLKEMERVREVGPNKFDGSDLLSHAASACFELREEEIVVDEEAVEHLTVTQELLEAVGDLFESQKNDLIELRQWLVDGSLEIDRRRRAG